MKAKAALTLTTVVLALSSQVKGQTLYAAKNEIPTSKSSSEIASAKEIDLGSITNSQYNKTFDNYSQKFKMKITKPFKVSIGFIDIVVNKLYSLINAEAYLKVGPLKLGKKDFIFEKEGNTLNSKQTWENIVVKQNESGIYKIVSYNIDSDYNPTKKEMKLIEEKKLNVGKYLPENTMIVNDIFMSILRNNLEGDVQFAYAGKVHSIHVKKKVLKNNTVEYSTNFNGFPETMWADNAKMSARIEKNGSGEIIVPEYLKIEFNPPNNIPKFTVEIEEVKPKTYLATF
ncbi:MAG: hypothetical protein ABH828_04195 [archaeon]